MTQDYHPSDTYLALDREAIAEALWRHEVDDLPALKRARDAEMFSEQSEPVRKKRLGYSGVILSLLSKEKNNV